MQKNEFRIEVLYVQEVLTQSIIESYCIKLVKTSLTYSIDSRARYNLITQILILNPFFMLNNNPFNMCKCALKFQ